MNRAILAAFLLVFCIGAFGQPDATSADQSAIRKVLDEQAAAWNRGDLEGYMAGYWKSQETTFYSGATVTSGWQATLDRYRAHYQAPGQEMGHLEFSELEIQVLSPTSAVVYGHWKLTKKGSEPHGLFTLVMRKLPEGWRIVHDHSS